MLCILATEACISQGSKRNSWIPVKLALYKREFGFEFCNFAVRFSAYVVWPWPEFDQSQTTQTKAANYSVMQEDFSF